MLTLPVPHSGDAARDFRTLQATWRRFHPQVQRYIRRRHMMPRDEVMQLPYARTLESTRSDGGHAHCHVWYLGPYLPHIVLRAYYGRALRVAVRDLGINARGDGVYVPVRLASDVELDIAGECIGDSKRLRRELADLEVARTYNRRQLRWLPWPVVDVRRCDSDTDVGNEIIKYLTVDKVIVASEDNDRKLELGDLVDPELYASLVEATIGARVLCTSRALWVALPKRCCPECDWSYRPVSFPKRTVLVDFCGPRGPPLSFIP